MYEKKGCVRFCDIVASLRFIKCHYLRKEPSRFSLSLSFLTTFVITKCVTFSKCATFAKIETQNRIRKNNSSNKGASNFTGSRLFFTQNNLRSKWIKNTKTSQLTLNEIRPLSLPNIPRNSLKKTSSLGDAWGKFV